MAGLVPGGPKGGVPGATNYSGLLECPCNGRYGGDPAFYPDGGKGGSRTRVLTHDFKGVAVGACGAAASCSASGPAGRVQDRVSARLSRSLA